MQSRGDWLEQRYRHSGEDPALHERYGDDFEFTVPPGVDFISADENVHFSSVLAYHAISKTIYSDDTLCTCDCRSLLDGWGWEIR